jgi:WD40 repeat protein
MKVPQQQQQQQQQPGFEIIKHGKLAYSSYYDILENHEQSLESAAEEALNEEGGNNNTSSHENQETCVRTCVFAPEPHDYVAWSCGYGLLRILRTSSSLWSTTKANCNKQQHPIEIDAGEHITSLAFGSSKSSSARPVRRSQRTRSSSTGVGVVYRRFHFDDIPDKLILAVGLSSGRIRIYDPVQGVFLFGLFDHSDHVRHLKFTQDGSLQLCSASADSTLKLWNMYDDGNMYMTLKGHDGLVNACDWSPVDNFLCSVANRDVFIWSTDTYAIVHRLKGFYTFDFIVTLTILTEDNI